METLKIIGVIAIVVGVIGGLMAVSNYLNFSSCRNNVLEMKKEFRYDIINGCRIGLEDGSFIYWEMYREVGN